MIPRLVPILRKPARPIATALAVLAVAGLGLAGCGPSRPREKVVIDGSSTVFRISRKAQLRYGKTHPDVRVYVGSHGTGGGFGRYLAGEVDIIDASRDAKPSEAEEARAKGLEWTRFVVGYDGITVVVHPSNPVEELSVEQLRDLFRPDSAVRSWRQVDPALPDRRIILHAPDVDSGTFEFFHDAVIGKSLPLEHRRDVQQAPDDNVLVSGVAGDAEGIGFFGYAYYDSNRDKLKPLRIRPGPDAPGVLPTTESILAGEYRPLSRPLYIFVKTAALARPAVADFVRFYLEDAGRFAELAGFVPPTEADSRANAEALEAALRTVAPAPVLAVTPAPRPGTGGAAQAGRIEP